MCIQLMYTLKESIYNHRKKGYNYYANNKNGQGLRRKNICILKVNKILIIKD